MNPTHTGTKASGEQVTDVMKYAGGKKVSVESGQVRLR